MDIERIKEYAQKNGWYDVEYVWNWNGYEVYKRLFKNNVIQFIGLPYAILVKDDEIRESTDDETFSMWDDYHKREREE